MPHCSFPAYRTTRLTLLAFKQPAFLETPQPHRTSSNLFFWRPPNLISGSPPILSEGSQKRASNGGVSSCRLLGAQVGLKGSKVPLEWPWSKPFWIGIPFWLAGAFGEFTTQVRADFHVLGLEVKSPPSVEPVLVVGLVDVHWGLTGAKLPYGSSFLGKKTLFGGVSEGTKRKTASLGGGGEYPKEEEERPIPRIGTLREAKPQEISQLLLTIAPSIQATLSNPR